jgi:hypothetical protein
METAEIMRATGTIQRERRKFAVRSPMDWVLVKPKQRMTATTTTARI